MAQKLFGNDDPLGKTIKIDSTANFTVTGVLEPLPSNTQFNYIEYIVPLNYMREVHWAHDDWETNSVNMYVMLKPGVPRQVAEKLFWNVFKRPACVAGYKCYSAAHGVRLVAVFQL